jgi:proteasome beta subunit
MSTVIGVACTDGVLLAGDRVVAADGRIRSRERRHVFDFGSVGVAAVGRDVDGFADRLDADLRSYRMDRGTVGIGPLSRIAADLAAEFDAAGVLAARDDHGRPRLRSVGEDGSLTDDALAAFGDGAPVVLGALEAGYDPDASLDAVATLVDDAFAAAAERDGGTGTELDRYRLSA